MGEKDISEKALEWMPDVFAEIVNAYFAIQGIERVVKPDELVDTKERTVYVSRGDLRDQERDVVKLWIPLDTVICLMGFENQTDVDYDMALRVFGYEGGDYRYQLTQTGAHYPVITIILYFGTNERWAKKRTLYERLKVPDDLKPLVNDCHVNVFEIAWLSDDEEKFFKSDFKHVVHYLRQVRMGKEKSMLSDPLYHAPELLTLLKALANDDRYDELIRQAKVKQKEGEIMTFPSLFEDAFPNIIKEKVEEKIPSLVQEAEKRAEERGIASGIAIGTAQTEARVQEERQIIRDRLIASGIPSQEAAVLTGLSV